METYYQRHREERLAYQRKHGKDHPEVQKKWRNENPAYKKKQAEYYAKWYAENGRNRADNYLECIYEYQQKYPQRLRIMRQVHYAIKKGKIDRPDTCSKCNKSTFIQAHHYNYDHYMNIIWLCAACHKKEHIKKNCS